MSKATLIQCLVDHRIVVASHHLRSYKAHPQRPDRLPASVRRLSTGARNAIFLRGGHSPRLREMHLQVLPNGSRLSCGRNTRARKELEPQTQRLDSEATQFFPTCERPAASSAC